jgi:6-phosphogluconolactonase (cycloisomerase 2 family)
MHDPLTPGKGATQIEAYSVAADGMLTKIPGSPFAGRDFPTQICANGKYLFASSHIEQGNNQYPSKMNSYWIGTNGALALSHILGNADLINITLDHTGEVLYGQKADSSLGDLLSYRVKWSDGGLEYLGQVTVPDLNYAGAFLDLPVTFSSDNRTAFETSVYAYMRED